MKRYTVTYYRESNEVAIEPVLVDIDNGEYIIITPEGVLCIMNKYDEIIYARKSTWEKIEYIGEE